MDFFDQLISVYNFDNVPLLVASVITFGIGFWEYIYSFRITHREKRSPFPIWMHTFYFAHDSTWAILSFIAASKHNWHWFLLSMSFALFAWTLFELYNLVFAITKERSEIWANYYPNGISAGQALSNVVIQVLGFYGLVNILIMFMGPGSVFQWALLTNMVMAVGPGILLMRRGSREGSSVGLFIVILLGTINTFIPISMFAQALPQTFNHPWYYITGVIISLIALGNLIMILKFPVKKQIAGQKRPIW